MNKELEEKIIAMIDSEFNDALRDHIRNYIGYMLSSQVDSPEIYEFIEQKARTKLKDEIIKNFRDPKINKEAKP